MRAHCSACRFRFDRGEPGYFMGAMMFNLIAAELAFVLGLVAVLWWTLPDPPWNAMLYGGIAFMVMMPILFFPLSRTLWIAFDLVFRPPRQEDTVPPDEG